jgi:competence protein ComEC
MQINTAQAGSLIIVVAGFGYWFLEKQKIGAWIGLFGLLFFTCVRSTSFYEAQQQQQFIIYNVPKHRAIDVIIARHYFFIGDSDLLTDAFTGNFYLKPSRVLHRLQASKFSPPENLLQFGSKRVLLVDQKPLIDNYPARIEIDLLVVSKDPRLSLAKLSEAFSIRQVVFDSSVPRRRIKYWMKDCDSLRIPYYDVNEKGAFVMNLN